MHEISFPARIDITKDLLKLVCTISINDCGRRHGQELSITDISNNNISTKNNLMSSGDGYILGHYALTYGKPSMHSKGTHQSIYV